MSNIWEPVGPLPAAVYWRRRFVALASAVTMVVLAIAAAGTAHVPAGTPVPAANRSTAPPGSPTPTLPFTVAPRPDVLDTPSAAAAPRTSRTAVPPTTPSAAPTTTSPPPVSTTPPAPASAVPAAAAPSAAPPTGERIRPDDGARSSVAAQSVPVPATGPVPCTNAMLSADAELDHLVHRVGSHPVLRLVITNTSGQPCVRDLDPARQEIVVWSADGTGRLWSSNDCVNVSSIDLRTLVPGRPVAFAVTWAERTSTPGCRQPRTAVPAGTYRLLVRLDDLISPPTPFIRTP